MLTCYTIAGVMFLSIADSENITPITLNVNNISAISPYRFYEDTNTFIIMKRDNLSIDVNIPYAVFMQEFTTCAENK
jgi:hypothetical protein